MISLRGIYDGNNFHFFDKLNIEKKQPQYVIVTFVDAEETDISKYIFKYPVKSDEPDISNTEIQQLISESKSFSFLDNIEEDIYSDEDLKIKY